MTKVVAASEMDTGISFGQAVTLCLHAPADDPIILVGPPGVGKSHVPQAVALALKASYWPLYLGVLEAVEINGLPHLYEKDGRKYGAWGPFSGLLPLQGEGREGHIVINPDDIGQASPSVAKAAIRSFYGDGLRRMVGAHELYHDVRIIGTSNLHTHRAGAHRFETWVTGRCNIVRVVADPLEWVQWAVGAGVHPSLTSWVQFTKQVTDFAPDRDQFMSPRSLTKLSGYLYNLEKDGTNGAVMRACVYGKIGETAGSAFEAWYKFREELPDMDAILEGRKVKLPTKPEVQYMFVTTLLQAAKEEHVPIVGRLISDLTEAGATGFEVAAFLTYECLKGAGGEKLRGIRTQSSLYKWLSEYGKYLP